MAITKYKDADGNWQKLNVKVMDTLPLGSVVEYNGASVPNGWEEITKETYVTQVVNSSATWTKQFQPNSLYLITFTAGGGSLYQVRTDNNTAYLDKLLSAGDIFETTTSGLSVSFRNKYTSPARVNVMLIGSSN